MGTLLNQSDLYKHGIPAGPWSGARPNPPPAERQFHMEYGVVTKLPLNQVIANPNQPRKFFDPDALRELANSIQERGVMEPIIVRPKDGRFEIVAGERRYRASQLAGMPDIPAVIRELTDEEAMADSLLENFQREDLTVIERARAIEDLTRMMSLDDCARRLGCSTPTLKRHMELLDLPDVIQQELSLSPGKQQSHYVTEGHARALRTFNKEPGLQIRLLEKLKVERLSVEELERLIEALQRAPERTEAFLRIPLTATEDLLRRSGVKLEKRRNFKRRTAEQYLQSFQKQSAAFTHLLDDEVTRYLNQEQMNQLLANGTQLLEDVEEFVRMVRRDLLAQDYGFAETYVFCSLCGRRELVGCGKCSICGTILKRCADCGHYDSNYQQCGFYGHYIYGSESEMPMEESHSTNCEKYVPRVEVRPKITSIL